MARKQVTLYDTFNTWRGKTNEISATVGDLSGLNANSEFTYTNPAHEDPGQFQGTSATFTVTKTDQYTVEFLTGGLGYTVGMEIVVPGTSLGGVDGVHDLTITVDSIGTDGVIDDFTVTGTACVELVAEVNQLRNEVGLKTSLDPQDPDGDALSTTAQTLYGAINELDAIQGDVTQWGTTATTLTGAVKELYADLGDVTAANMDTDSSTVVTAINELAGEIGDFTQISTATGVDLGDDLVSAVNALKGQTDDLQTELGGDVATDYDGTSTTVITALNELYDASSIGTLDNTYLKRDGSLSMNQNAHLQLSNVGLSVELEGDALLFKTWNETTYVTDETGSSDPAAPDYNPNYGQQSVDTIGTLQQRMAIAPNTGNVGIGTDPSNSYKLNVAGKLKANNLYYGTQDTDNRYLKIGSSQGVIDTAMTFNKNVIINPVDTNGALIPNLTLTVHGEVIADTTTGAEFTVSDFVRTTVQNYLSSADISFNASIDANGDDKLDLTVLDDSHSHVTGDIDNLQEFIEDTVGGMIGTVVQGTVTNSSQQAGISVAYVDNGTGQGFLNFDVDDFSVHIGRTKAEKDNVDGDGNSQPLLGDAGDVYGEFTITNLGSVEDIALTVRPQVIRDNTAAFVQDGTGISVTLDNLTTPTSLTIANTDLGSAQHIFKTIKAKTKETGVTVFTSPQYNYTADTANSGSGGSGALFDVVYEDTGTTQSYTLQLKNGGDGYFVGDELEIDGANIGGTTGVNNLTITVTNVSVTDTDKQTGIINSTSHTGTPAALSSTDIGSISVGSNTDTLTLVESDGIDLAVDSTNKKIILNLVREHVEDIVGNMFDNNFATGLQVQYIDSRTTPSTDLGKVSLTVDQLAPGSIVLTGDVTGSLSQGTTGLEIDTTLGSGAVGVNEIAGLDEQIRDVVKNYIDVSNYTSGSTNVNTGLSKTVIDALDEKLFYADSDDVTAAPSNNVNGGGAIFYVTKFGQSYNVSVSTNGGQNGGGYVVGDAFSIDGTELDGVSGTHDLTITVNGVDSNGGITSLTVSGVSNASTQTVDKLRLQVTATPEVSFGGQTSSIAAATADHIAGYGNAGDGSTMYLQIKQGAVTSNEIANGTIQDGDIKPGTISRSSTTASASLKIYAADGVTVVKEIWGWGS